MEYENMTTEQLIQIIEEHDTAIQDLTAERDSLQEELTTLRGEDAARIEELASVKKLNYTLARQLDKTPQAGFDDTLINLYGRK